MSWCRFEAVPDIKTRAARLVSQLTRPVRQTTSQSRVHSVAPTSQRFFVGASNKKAKLIVLQITGMTDDASKKLCEKCLLSVSVHTSLFNFYRFYRVFSLFIRNTSIPISNIVDDKLINSVCDSVHLKEGYCSISCP